MISLFFAQNSNNRLVKLHTAQAQGFTIIEAVVSVAIFSMVMVVGAGALMSIMGANRKAQSTKSAVDNLNFAIDSMTRAIRTGIQYRCNDTADADKNCGITSEPGTSFSFQEKPSVPGVRIKYSFSPILGGASICPAVGGTIIREKADGSGGVITEALTSDEVHISSLKFYVYGANLAGGAVNPDLQQPRVVIAATGFAGTSPKDCTTFNIHTSVTQRAFENDY